MPNYFNVLGQTYNSEHEPCFLTTGTPKCYNRLRKTWHLFDGLQEAYDKRGHPNGTWGPNEFGVPSADWVASNMPDQDFAVGFGPGVSPNPPIPDIPETPAVADVPVQMRWVGNLVSGTTYYPGDTVNDFGWMGVAIRETTDRLEPQENGSPTYDVGDAPAFVVQQNNGVVWSGHEYVFNTGGWVERIEVWVPAIAGAITYRIALIDMSNPNAPTVSYVVDPVLTAGEWSTVAIGRRLVKVGSVFQVIIDADNSGTSTEVAGGWLNTGSSQDTSADPGVGAYSYNNQATSFTFNKTDLDSVDRGTELLGVIPGSIIQVAQADNPTQSWSMQVTGDLTDYGTHVQYPTTRFETTGNPAEDAPAAITIEIPIPAGTDYEELVGGSAGNQPTWAAVTGVKTLSGIEDPAAVDNTYGVRIQFQPGYVSPDWNITVDPSATAGGS